MTESRLTENPESRPSSNFKSRIPKIKLVGTLLYFILGWIPATPHHGTAGISSHLHSKETVSYWIKNSHFSGDPQLNSSWKLISIWIISYIIIHSKYFAVPDSLTPIPRLILHNQEAQTIFGRWKQHTVDSVDWKQGWSMVYLNGNEASWATVN